MPSSSDLLASYTTFPSSTPALPDDAISHAGIPKISLENQINTNNSVINHTNIKQIDSDSYQLPLKSTRGKPPDRYSLDNFKLVKYPIENYVYTHQLSPANEAL